MRSCGLGAVAAVLLAAAAVQSHAEPGDFDFYVLALSWSPSWCEGDGAGSGSRQCRAGADHGFVVHGLWPQYERGYPEHCADGPRVPAPAADAMLDIMPDRRLIFSQWRKHGTCTGLSPTAYLEETRAAYDSVVIPAPLADPARDRTVSALEVEAAFAAANPGLTPEGIAISCEAGRLEEVRICLSRDLGFRVCPEVNREGCRQKRLRLPAAE